MMSRFVCSGGKDLFSCNGHLGALPNTDVARCLRDSTGDVYSDFGCPQAAQAGVVRIIGLCIMCIDTCESRGAIETIETPSTAKTAPCR